MFLVPCSSDIALTQNAQNVQFGDKFAKKSPIFDNKLEFPLLSPSSDYVNYLKISIPHLNKGSELLKNL